VPCMIGYFKPLILLPVSIATYLSACEIEAILLHELSHIKRHDYLINLMQQVIKVVLFFNPFAQLISRIINLERENSCDDLVIEKTRKPLIYARALLKLEETRGAKLQLALAATGKKHYLLNRIERIMKTKQPIGNIRHLAIAIFLLAGSLGSIAWFNPSTANAETKSPGVHQLIAVPHFAADTTKGLSAIKSDTSNSILIDDTIKHHHKKATISKNGVKKEYDPDADSTGMDSLRKFYSGAAWRNQMEMIRKNGEEMRKHFNSPEWKSQMDAMRKQGEELRKKFNGPEWKAQMLAMQKQGEEMKKQFNSPEWKEKMDAMKKQGEEMKKQFDSPEWKEKMELLKKQGEDMRKKFEGPEWKKQMELMQKQGEDMRKKFNGPEWKKQMEDMQKQGEIMRKQFDKGNWDMKGMKWKLADSVGGVQINKPAKKDSL
jgi:bla regulator protein blaR1